MSEPEPVSQGGEEGEVEGGGELEQVSEPLEAVVDNGGTEQVGHNRYAISNIDDICIFRVRNWSH